MLFCLSRPRQNPNQQDIIVGKGRYVYFLYNTGSDFQQDNSKLPNGGDLGENNTIEEIRIYPDWQGVDSLLVLIRNTQNDDKFLQVWLNQWDPNGGQSWQSAGGFQNISSMQIDGVKSFDTADLYWDMKYDLVVAHWGRVREGVFTRAQRFRPGE